MSTPAEQLAEPVSLPSPHGLGAEIEAALGRPLDSGRVKKKPGTSFDYIGHADMRRTANAIFGYGGWGYTTDDVQVLVQAPLVKGDREGVQAMACARVTLQVRLADGTWLTKGGVGEGTGNGYGPTAVVEAPGKAVKEAESDALKRAFMNLGDQFGLILYAKDEEREVLQQEALEREYALPADDAAVEAANQLAVNVHKAGETLEAIEKERADHGGIVRQGWLSRVVTRLEELAANPQPEQPDAPAEELRLVPADKVVDDQALAEILEGAERLGGDAHAAAIQAIEAHAAQNIDGHVHADWLDKLGDAIDTKLLDAGLAGVGQDADGAGDHDASVAAAFGGATEAA